MLLKFLHAFIVLSYVFFLAALAWTYSNLPLKISLGNLQTDKDMCYYFILGLFVITNLALILLYRVLKSTAKDFIGLYGRELNLLEMVRALQFIINVFLINIIAYIGLINSNLALPHSSVGWMIYIAPTMLLVAVLLFLYPVFFSERSKMA